MERDRVPCIASRRRGQRAAGSSCASPALRVSPSLGLPSYVHVAAPRCRRFTYQGCGRPLGLLRPPADVLMCRSWGGAHNAAVTTTRRELPRFHTISFYSLATWRLRLPPCRLAEPPRRETLPRCDRPCAVRVLQYTGTGSVGFLPCTEMRLHRGSGFLACLPTSDIP